MAEHFISMANKTKNKTFLLTELPFYVISYALPLTYARDWRGKRMVSEKQGDVDIENLRLLYRDDKTAQAFLNQAARRERNARKTTVERTLANLAQDGYDASRPEIVQMFRTLAKLGCGEFVVGRHNHPSRFRWNVSLVSVGRAASGESQEIEKITDEQDFSDETVKSLTHSYRLRPSLVVEFELPGDLTESEANRLADYIKTLPFKG
jgi:hypothetical protein